jgi:putative nucleotidyltransferase with HDIG domain
LENFHNYTKTVLKEIGQIESETVRQEKMRTAVRELVSDLFVDDVEENTFGKSKAIIEELSKTVSTMMKEEHPVILKRMESLLNEEQSFYRHLSNVSTYAMVFAMALGLEKPTEIAIAGILHDIGKTALPMEIADQEPEQMGPHAFEAYQKHPELTIEVIKMKRVPLPERVTKCILQHHERMDGQGYPQQLNASRICVEAKVLAIADEFDYLTALKPGRPKLTPRQALDELIQDNSHNPGRMRLDLELLLTLRGVLYEGKTLKKDEKNGKSFTV